MLTKFLQFLLTHHVRHVKFFLTSHEKDSYQLRLNLTEFCRAWPRPQDFALISGWFFEFIVFFVIGQMLFRWFWSITIEDRDFLKISVICCAQIKQERMVFILLP